MIDSKEIPKEYVSIRQIWLVNINRCSEAISNRAKPDMSQEGNWQEIGQRTVIQTVKALHYTLIDYGEATVKTEIDRYKEINIYPKLEKGMEIGRVANLYEKLFMKIIEVLNKYNMLFEQAPEGYSNVTMEAVK